MIRNVVLGRLNANVDPSEIEAGLAAIADLHPDGLIDCRVGTDLALRDGTWDFAITSDFVDADAYRRYDLDEEHNQIRQELIAPLCATIARVQFAC